ncbi:MAG: OmpA family protein [Clostridia bacterium]|nr:OmpA family protein [Clostridia bacterium]
MKAKRIVALLLVALMIVSFASCREKEPVNEANKLTEGALPDNLMAEKVGSLDTDDFYTADGGLYYKDEATGKFGVMSFEGNYDTGAVYATCNPAGLYFKVARSDVSKRRFTEPKTLNDTGLIDSKGNVIIPEMYAYVQNISERYALAVEATKLTASVDRALVSYPDDDITDAESTVIADEETDTLYSGKWYVYDKTTGKKVPGVTGETEQTVVSYGDFIVYNDDNGEKHVVDANGKELVHNRLFEDGSYSIEGKIGTVYNCKGEKLFDYDLASYVPKYVKGDYYEASVYTDEGTKYVLMDKNGKVLSTEFSESINVYGDLILVDGMVCDTTGKNIIKGTYETITYDELFGECWILRNNDTYTMINRKGEVLYEDVDKKDVTVWGDDFVASQKNDDGDSMFFSHKDKDYTIKGYSFAPWLVQTSANNNLYNVVSTISGETIFEGYSSYSYTTVKNTALYIYAKYNGGADVYLIVNDALLKDMVDKKTELLDDLTGTFEKEGITVTINKETGELSLDSSVLFGGDSAELTAEGKAFLDKFVKAYTSIAYSDEYEGFIAKTIVEGHTAPTADSSYAGDLQLSEDRANNVKAYCVATQSGSTIKGFAEDLEAIGYSNSQPVYGADGSVDMDASRRVSFRFMLNIDLLD